MEREDVKNTEEVKKREELEEDKWLMYHALSLIINGGLTYLLLYIAPAWEMNFENYILFYIIVSLIMFVLSPLGYVITRTPFLNDEGSFMETYITNTMSIFITISITYMVYIVGGGILRFIVFGFLGF